MSRSSQQPKNEETFSIPYTVFPREDGTWTWGHDVSGKVSRKTYPTKAEAVQAAKAAFMQSREEDHIAGGQVTLVGRARSKRDFGGDGTHTILTFSDGTIRKIQKMNAAESFGIGGWHYIDVAAGDVHTWIAGSEKDAIAEILRKKNR